nr:MAG TPA: hypothetical protein [Caudoviricetes sp.]
MLLKLQVEPGKINSLTLFRSCLYRGSSFLLGTALQYQFQYIFLHNDTETMI